MAVRDIVQGIRALDSFDFVLALTSILQPPASHVDLFASLEELVSLTIAVRGVAARSFCRIAVDLRCSGGRRTARALLAVDCRNHPAMLLVIIASAVGVIRQASAS